MILNRLKKVLHVTSVRKHVMGEDSPTQVNAAWILTSLLTEATPNQNQSQAPPWLFLFNWLFFGIYPATRAAALDPVTSLRYE